MAATPQKLTPIQVHLLRFFSEHHINDQETDELKQIIAHYYAQKADKLMEKIWKEKGYNKDSIVDILEKDLK